MTNSFSRNENLSISSFPIGKHMLFENFSVAVSLSRNTLSAGHPRGRKFYRRIILRVDINSHNLNICRCVVILVRSPNDTILFGLPMYIIRFFVYSFWRIVTTTRPEYTRIGPIFYPGKSRNT